MQVATSLSLILLISGSDAITRNLCKPPPVALRSPGSLAKFGIEATRWAVDARDAEFLLSPLVNVFSALDRDSLMSHHNGVRTIRASTREQHYVFHEYPAGICRPMHWVYAGDKRTLDIFRPLAARIRPPVDAALCAEATPTDLATSRRNSQRLRSSSSTEEEWRRRIRCGTLIGVAVRRARASPRCSPSTTFQLPRRQLISYSSVHRRVTKLRRTAMQKATLSFSTDPCCTALRRSEDPHLPRHRDQASARSCA